MRCSRELSRSPPLGGGERISFGFQLMTAHAEVGTAKSAAAIGLHNWVLPVLFLAGAAAVLAAGFVTLAPNRLLSGRPIGLFAEIGRASCRERV